MRHIVWFFAGILLGYTAISIGKCAIPPNKGGAIPNHIKIYQQVTEIKNTVKKENDPVSQTLLRDLQLLKQMEKRATQQ